MKKLFDFFLFGNFIVSVGCFALIYSTTIQLKLPGLPYYAILCTFSTFFIYNIQRIFYNKKTQELSSSERRKWVIKNQRIIWYLSLIGFAGTTIVFFLNDFKIIEYLLPLFILSVAYFLPVIKLRKYGFIKMIVLVLVWTCTTSLIPVLMSTTTFSTSHIAQIGSRFCFMMAICLPFDVRDIEIDKMESISTISHRIGVRKTIIAAVVFSIAYELFNVVLFSSNVIGLAVFLSLSFVFLICFFLILLTRNSRHDYFYLGAIDGLMILEGLLIYLTK